MYQKVSSRKVRVTDCRSSEPPLQFARVSRGMENRNDNQLSRLFLQGKVNRVTPTRNLSLACKPADKSKPLWILSRSPYDFPNVLRQLLADSGLLFIVPCDSLLKFLLSLWFDDDFPTHFAV